MKKVKLVTIVMLSVFFGLMSCKNSEKDNNQSNDSTEVVINDNNVDQQNDDDDDVVVVNSKTIEIKAQFNGIALGSDGGHILFRNDAREYDFYDDGNAKVHDIFSDIDASNPNDETHLEEWYKIVYKKDKKLFYDGGTGKDVERDVLIIIDIEPLKKKNTSANSGITLSTLKNAIFFGNIDINWTMKFKDDKIEYTPNIGEDTYDLFYYPDKNSCLKTISPTEVQMKTTFNLSNGYISTITIKKEACSDGESSNVYPYSIHVTWEGSESSGCGRNL